MFLLFLAWRHHSRGQHTVWVTPVTSVPWFYSREYSAKEKEAELPPPVTAPVDRSRSKDAGALKPPKDTSHHQKRAKPQDLGKIRTTGLTPPPKGRQQSYEYKHGYWLPKSADAPPAPPPPPKASVSRPNTREKTRDRDQSRERSREGREGRHRTRTRTRESSSQPHRSTRDHSLTRDNSGRGSKRPSARHPSRDPYYREASPRR